MYMSSIRTQVYLTAEQRRRLDARMRRDGKRLAEVIREAVDAYLAAGPDAATVLDATFGVSSRIEVPSRDEWDRG
jgi:predicted DNA-binding protein